MLKKQSPMRHLPFIVVSILIILSVSAIVMVMKSSPHRALSPIDDSTTDSTQPIKMHVTAPQPGETVDGQVSVQGDAANAGEYRVEVRDRAGALGEKMVTVSNSGAFSVLVPLTASPHDSRGEVKIMNGHQDTMVVPVRFKIQEAAGKVALQGPLPNQIMKGSSVDFRGSMKGFFEGVLHIRLKDDRGAVLFTDTIHAKTDNYEQYAKFDTTVRYGTIVAANLGSGSWELYDVSPKDGSESAILSFPVRFKE